MAGDATRSRDARPLQRHPDSRLVSPAPPRAVHRGTIPPANRPLLGWPRRGRRCCHHPCRATGPGIGRRARNVTHRHHFSHRHSESRLGGRGIPHRDRHADPHHRRRPKWRTMGSADLAAATPPVGPRARPAGPRTPAPSEGCHRRRATLQLARGALGCLEALHARLVHHALPGCAGHAQAQPAAPTPHRRPRMAPAGTGVATSDHGRGLASGNGTRAPTTTRRQRL